MGRVGDIMEARENDWPTTFLVAAIVVVALILASALFASYAVSYAYE